MMDGQPLSRGRRLTAAPSSARTPMRRSIGCERGTCPARGCRCRGRAGSRTQIRLSSRASRRPRTWPRHRSRRTCDQAGGQKLSTPDGNSGFLDEAGVREWRRLVRTAVRECVTTWDLQRSRYRPLLRPRPHAVDSVTPSRVAAVSTYLQGEFPSATISVVARQSLGAHLFRVDMEDGTNPYAVLVLNEVLRDLSDTVIPKRFGAWNVSSLMRVAVKTVEVSVLGPSIRRRE